MYWTPTRVSAALALLIPTPLSACSSSSVVAAGDTDGSTGGTDSAGADGGSSDGTTGSNASQVGDSGSDPGDGSGSGSTSPNGETCGDGVLDAHEQCDDGDIVGGDGCESDCTLSNLQPWSYLGELFTSARALAIGPDGTVVVGGAWGDAWETGYYTPLLRTFAADGELLEETDSIVADDGFVNEVVQRRDGRFWLLGARGSHGWIRRVDARSTDDTLYNAFDGFVFGHLGVEHIAVGSQDAVAMLDVGSTELIWQLQIGGVDDVAIAGNGDLLAVGKADFDAPVELRRFSPDGDEVGEPRVLTPLDRCKLGSSALGIVLACMQDVGDDSVSTELALYDDVLAPVWSVSMPDRQVFSVEADDHEILVAGADYGSGEGYIVPLGFGLDAEGEETWSFAPDPAEFGLTSGLLGDVARTPDGALVFTGEMRDFDIGLGASYAYVVRAEP